MEWPELPTHGHAEFTVWYEKVTRRFFDEVHTIKSVEATIDGDTASVKVVVNWKASVWEPPTPKSISSTWTRSRRGRSCASPRPARR